MTAGELLETSVLAFVLLSVVWLLYRFVLFRTKVLSSRDFYDHRSERVLQRKRACFPPCYPNGWFRVAASCDVDCGKVKSISALGQDLVAFRGKDGRVGVLHAYCPHLGAHLGQGGRVVDGALQCPFHKWSFDTNGKCTDIPYCRTEVPARAKTKAFEVREHLGMIFIWHHADGEPPGWELECHKDVVDTRRFYYATMKHAEFDQHVLEMHMNSADYFHFQTLHRPMPIPILDRFIFGLHRLKAQYFQDAIPGSPHIALFSEDMIALYLLGKWRLPLDAVLRNIETKVTFEGPSIVHFRVKTMFGEMRMIKTILPVGEFRQYVEARWWAEHGVPRWMVWIMSNVAVRALNQDREVWRSKMYHEKPMLVSGDGPFPAFKRYYGQFYSESSRLVGKVKLDW